MISTSNAVMTEGTDPAPDCAAEVAEQLASGRGALAMTNDPAITPNPQRDEQSIDRLFALLWHRDDEVRRTAALALPGGDRKRPYQPQYGYFAAAFLRYIAQHSAHGAADNAARYKAVVAAICSTLQQNCSDLRAMCNMHYSFLSSALYLALLSTCRDGMESARRVRDSAPHRELCRLLGILSRTDVLRRLNPADAEALAALAGQALAAMPANEIPEFWHALTHHSRARRRAVAPALRYISDPGAVPYLIHSLAGQPANIAQALIACLGRIGAPDALPVLTQLASGHNRVLRSEAQSAIAAIHRVGRSHPSRTLLRPAHESPDESPVLLRTVDLNARRAIDQLVRPLNANESETANDV